MVEPRLLWEVDVDGFGGDGVVVTDLDGDGETEFVVRQGAGSQRSEVQWRKFGPRGAYTEEERRQDCITAVDLEGTRLWQLGEPHGGEDPHFCHGSADFDVACLGGDILPDVVAVLWDTLTTLDGRTGKVKGEHKLPGDNFGVVVPVSLTGDPGRQQVLVKVSGAAYPPYRLGNPAIVLDSDLSVLWAEDYYPGAGSRPVVLDLDGDGCDEILIGYSLVDHDGRLLWTFPVEDPDKEHVDNVNPADLDGDGRFELAYSGSKDFLVVSTDGEPIWKREHTHSQTSIAGRFRADVEGLTLILNEKWIGMTCYTPTGEKVWSKEGVGYARHPVHGWGEGGLDLIVYQPHLKKEWAEVPFHSIPEDTVKYWPYLMDGDGNRVMELPWREDYVQPRQRIRGFRAYDYGIGFHVEVMDVDGDGREEIIVWDRRRVMAFGLPG